MSPRGTEKKSIQPFQHLSGRWALLLTLPPKVRNSWNTGMGFIFGKSKNKIVLSMIIHIWASIVYKKQFSMYRIEKLCSFISTSSKLFSGRVWSQLPNLRRQHNTYQHFMENEHLTELRWNALNQGKFVHRNKWFSTRKTNFSGSLLNSDRPYVARTCTNNNVIMNTYSAKCFKNTQKFSLLVNLIGFLMMKLASSFYHIERAQIAIVFTFEPIPKPIMVF